MLSSRGGNYTVTSEISPFLERDTYSEPIVDERNVVSRFTMVVPDLSSDEEEDDRDEMSEVFHIKRDKDGDYVVPRNRLFTSVIVLEHSIYSKLSEVGMQIWRAALLLADFIIHYQKIFDEQTVLELGSGVGFTSIVAGVFSRQVISTDIDTGNTLKLLRANIERNRNVFRGDVCVLGLDFFKREWSREIQQKMQEVTIVLAADVVYDNDVTEAFVNTITKILNTPPNKTVYLALEKRYVFTVSEMDAVAPCFDHLIECIRKAQSKRPFCNWSFIEMPLTFRKYFNYERTKQLVMFKILT